MPRARIWTPYLLVLLVQAAFILLLVSFHRPTFLPIGLPLVHLLGGEAATHYRAFYLALPTMFSRIDIVIGVLVTSIASGIVTVSFAKAFGFDPDDTPWRIGLRKAPGLVVLAALTAGVFIAVGSLRSLVPDQAIAANFGLRWGLRALGLVVFVVVQSLLVYTTAWMVLGGQGVFSAILQSVRVTARTLVPTLLVVGIPTVFLYPLTYALSRADYIVDRLRPEMVTMFLAVQELTQVVALFLVIGAVTRLFTLRMRSTA